MFEDNGTRLYIFFLLKYPILTFKTRVSILCLKSKCLMNFAEFPMITPIVSFVIK